MKITKIIIKNFKSIKEIEFDIKKYGDSYTTMLLGINESGKSNILQAISFFNPPKEEFDYNVIRNQKDENNYNINLLFHLDFENKNTFLNEIRNKIENGSILNFKIDNIVKHVCLQKNKRAFKEEIVFNIKGLTENLFIKNILKDKIIDGKTVNISFKINKKNDEETYEKLTEELFKDCFTGEIINIIKKNEPDVSFWKPSDKYLISEVNLNEFKENINSNIPLKHIFILSGFKTEKSIKEKIDEISNDQLRRKLMSSLSNKSTEYIKKIWKHNIEIDIEITDSNKCIVSIKDEGKKNEHNFYEMNARSDGFKQFISLILSLSIETKELGKKNNLILIDEPEAHLHPSGIRDLREELLKIGKNNYLFVSTHSPFLVDRKNKGRNIIIKKNDNALTEKKEIKSDEDIRSDEVLDEAFGINIYKDLLISHRILVEGASDKMILQKSFSVKKYEYGITNGKGSNIVQIASKLNHDDIDILVVVDDDEDGKSYKGKILKIKGVYNRNNVLTIRDLISDIKNEGTIEDTLGKEFITSKFKAFYKSKFGKEVDNIVLDDSPFIKQIKVILQKQNNKFSKEILDKFKEKISNYKSEFGEEVDNIVLDDSPFIKQIKVILQQQNNKFSKEILNKFKEKISNYKSEFGEEVDNIVLDDSPFIKQIKVILQQQNNKFSKEILDKFKEKISNDFVAPPNKKIFDEKFPLLSSLVNKIKEKLET